MQLNEFLTTASQLAPVISAFTAIVAAIFISRQVNNIRRNREVDTLFKLIDLVDSERMREAQDWLYYQLRHTVRLSQVKADKEVFRKFSNTVHLFETMGVIANHKLMSESLIFDKYGLLIIGAWHKLEHLINGHRLDSQSKEYAENFELLVSRYDHWARNFPLKALKGDRVRLRDGRHLLDYEGTQVKRDDSVGTGSDSK